MQRTTIQVHRDLLDQLDEVKRELGASSYEQAIRGLLKEHRRVPDSAFGSVPKLRPFKRDELDRVD